LTVKKRVSAFKPVKIPYPLVMLVEGFVRFSELAEFFS
jgi:hypothetical protein